MHRPLTVVLALLVVLACSDDAEVTRDSGGTGKDGSADLAGRDRSGGDGTTDGTAPDALPRPDGVSPDAGADPCSTCKADEICVQSFDGTCTTWPPSCNKVSAACLKKKGTPGAACDPQCESEFCSTPFQCQNQIPCGTEKGGVDIYCYGP